MVVTTVFIPENPPTVTLIGDATVTLNQGESYTEPNPAATVIGGVLERFGTPPTGSVAGTFTIRYVARNVFGDASTERVVTVVAVAGERILSAAAVYTPEGDAASSVSQTSAAWRIRL